MSLESSTSSMLDGSPVRTYSVWWLVALGLGSAVFSVSMFFWQAVHHTDQASGKIVSIMDSSVMIVDVRDEVTELKITPVTTIHIPRADKAIRLTMKPPTNDITNLSIGQFIHAFGTVDSSGQFISEDIRVMKQHDLKLPE